jgi:hypothetical protein
MAATKSIKILTLLVLAIAVLFCLYLIQQNSRLNRELNALKSTEPAAEITSAESAALRGADSLFFAGAYNKALKQYKTLAANSSQPIQLRLTAAVRLRDMEQMLNSLRQKGEKIDSLNVVAVRLEPDTQRTIDSLSFALEKSQMQLKTIKNQIQNRVYGEYITFKSTKGNRLHYVGEVKHKKANGYGIAILDSGSRYEGEWLDNQRHGKGVFYWIDGEHYEGEYKQDQRSGLGTYYWTSGEKFTGNWENDMRNGFGTFYGKDGERVTSGFWEDDQLVKKESE